MSKSVSNASLAQAIARAAETGALPDDQDVVSAPFTADTFPAVKEELAKSRKQAEDEVRKISRDVGPEADKWMQQARQLQADIEQSKAVAKEIVRQAEQAKEIKRREEDEKQKAELLRKELDFNRQLTAVIEQIRTAGLALSRAQASNHDGNLSLALEDLERVEASVRDLSALRSTNAVRLLSDRAVALRHDMVGQSDRRWKEIFSFDAGARSFTLPSRAPDSSEPLSTTLQVTRKLGTLTSSTAQLARELQGVILTPRFVPKTPGSRHAPSLKVDGGRVTLSKTTSQSTTAQALADAAAVSQALSDGLVPPLDSDVPELIMPKLIEDLVGNWLQPELPVSAERHEELETLLSSATRFADHLAELGWPGGAELTDWVESVPKHWLAKRRQTALGSVRSALQEQLDQSKIVERAETQMVERGELVDGVENNETQWDAEWDEDQQTDESKDAKVKVQAEVPDKDDDTAAWDWEEEEEQTNGSTEAPASKPHSSQNPGDDEDEEDTAAWDDWDDKKSTSAPASPTKTRTAPQDSGPHGTSADQNGPGRQEVTLRESYTVTGVPDTLLDIVSTIGRDAEVLSGPLSSKSPVAAAANGLHSIPTLVFAGFRALAASYYQHKAGGNMYLYNDSVRLADSLSGIIRDQPSWLSPRMKLESEIATLESFSRRAYGKEMESQRTIVRDLLDGAQGFASCTEQPFASECANAISATVDRVRQVAKEWETVLSRSALLQTMGSLLSTVLGKIIADIEDLSDIGDEESKTLRKLFTEVGTLNELFMQDNGGGEETDVTGAYTPNWFKFQYLSELMESSLADIKYLWNEGGLKLEFEADELIDLIEALFADSDHRRRAIAEIRRS